MDEREFHISKGFVTTTRWAAWAFIVFAILEVSVLYFDPPKTLDSGAVFFILAGIFFLALSIWGFWFVRNIGKYSVAIDSNGIRSLDPNRLDVKLQWSDLGKIKERFSRQRLDLFDRRGEKVISLEYQLEGFEDLRRIVLDQVGRSATVRLPVHYAKGCVYHVLNWGSIVLLSYASYHYYVPRLNSLLFVGMAIVALALIAREHFQEVVAITINSNEIILRYPFRRITVGTIDITDIRVHDEFVKGSRVPHVLITTKLGRTHKIRNLGINAGELANILKYAKDQGGH